MQSLIIFSSIFYSFLTVIKYFVWAYFKKWWPFK